VENPLFIGTLSHWFSTASGDEENTRRKFPEMVMSSLSHKGQDVTTVGMTGVGSKVQGQSLALVDRNTDRPKNR
jgi:hypothetical protein